MGFKNGLAALAFVSMAVVIVFLSFRVYETDKMTRDVRESDRDKIPDIAKNTMRAYTQQNPVLSYETGVKATEQFNAIIERYGSISAAEQALKLPGQLDQLRSRLHLVTDRAGSHLYDVVIANDNAQPSSHRMDLESRGLGLSETARMTNRKAEKSSRKKTRSSKESST